MVANAWIDLHCFACLGCESIVLEQRHLYLSTDSRMRRLSRAINRASCNRRKTHSITSFKFKRTMVKLNKHEHNKENKLYIGKLNGIEIQIRFVFFKYIDIIC